MPENTRRDHAVGAAGAASVPARQTITVPLLATLALLAAIAPFATDLYLPAFPQMAAGLGTGAAGVQLSLTTFLVGAALGQLLFGPLSDRFGRMPPILLGTLVCALASAATALAANITFLVVARFVQGLAASAGMVVGRAIISDLSEDRGQAARAFSLLMTVVGIAPVLAPWLGSMIVGPLGWRGTLWTVFGIAVLTLGAVLVFVRESHPAKASRRQGAALAPRDAGWASLLSRSFLGNTFAFGLAFAAMMAYISASPFLFQVVMGLSVVQYGLLFALILIVLTSAGVWSARLVARVPARSLLRVGLSILVAASLALACVVFLGLRPVWSLIPITVAVGSLGFVLGNATSAAMAAMPQAIGAGSAVLGALQFGLGALAAPLVGLRGERSAAPLAVVMAVASVLALTAFHVAESASPEEPVDESDVIPAVCDGE